MSSTSRHGMPAEWEPHERTIMAWPADRRIWGGLIAEAQLDVATVAKAIARFEPVLLMARPEHRARAQAQCGPSVQVVPVPVDDLWARDTGPVFVHGPDGLAGVDLNFNGWGGKQEHADDARVAENLLDRLDVPRISAPITTEGGALEVDSEGTLLATESSLVNDNRNAGRDRGEIELALRDLLGVRKVIWLKGVAGQDVTDCHVDTLARFVEPGVVVLNRPSADAPADAWSAVSDQALAVLRTATDAQGRALRVVELPEPNPNEIIEHDDEFLASYLNFYVLNGAVIVPRFGDRDADDRAADLLRELHPGREVVQLTINGIASGGGGIHCATQQQPRGPRQDP
ncbi:agmatine deiminase family protein [Solihabitans fulvus]|uniref:Agmatine deiminase family protein n=1 Tax=Solihabitans fulvus TaxID=1892852 RepID=A0A5B2WUU4_9PSEU|nr:agmatine deiminase family protein [Solihabitans fulvus]KAA2254462.1 agmatine deiminase family protein [Solihabitans fulvus]